MGIANRGGLEGFFSTVAGDGGGSLVSSREDSMALVQEAG